MELAYFKNEEEIYHESAEPKLRLFSEAWGGGGREMCFMILKAVVMRPLTSYPAEAKRSTPGFRLIGLEGGALHEQKLIRRSDLQASRR